LPASGLVLPLLVPPLLETEMLLLAPSEQLLGNDWQLEGGVRELNGELFREQADSAVIPLAAVVSSVPRSEMHWEACSTVTPWHFEIEVSQSGMNCIPRAALNSLALTMFASAAHALYADWHSDVEVSPLPLSAHTRGMKEGSRLDRYVTTSPQNCAASLATRSVLGKLVTGVTTLPEHASAPATIGAAATTKAIR
jgi:hypothetical protein